MSGPVYCGDCLHYWRGSEFRCDRCGAEPTVIDRYYGPELLYADPSWRNGCNACKRYEPTLRKRFKDWMRRIFR